MWSSPIYSGPTLSPLCCWCHCGHWCTHRLQRVSRFKMMILFSCMYIHCVRTHITASPLDHHFTHVGINNAKTTQYMQWNPSIAATLGEQNVGRYIGVAFIEGLFLPNCSFGTWIPAEVAFIQGWLLRGVPLYVCF